MFNFITSSVLGAGFMKLFSNSLEEMLKTRTPQNLVNNIFGSLLLSKGFLGGGGL